jgi:hypothetical protein
MEKYPDDLEMHGISPTKLQWDTQETLKVSTFLWQNVYPVTEEQLNLLRVRRCNLGIWVNLNSARPAVWNDIELSDCDLCSRAGTTWTEVYAGLRFPCSSAQATKRNLDWANIIQNIPQLCCTFAINSL